MSQVVAREVLLLDMGGTFMFGCDRFSNPLELGRTYRRLGGRRLNDRQVSAAIAHVIGFLGERYVQESYYEIFPSVRDSLLECEVESTAVEEAELLVEVFGQHEVGWVPERYRSMLRSLAARHRLGVVSNVWAPSSVFRTRFEEAGVADLFEVAVFSSDHGCIRPSTQLFRFALDALGSDPSQAAFVGDDLRCDIGGAKRSGMMSIWINPDGARLPTVCTPDLAIRDLGELLASQAVSRS